MNTTEFNRWASATVRSEFEYLIHDSEIESRNRTEVAFEHLRRMIAVAYSEVREKWEVMMHKTSR